MLIKPKFDILIEKGIPSLPVSIFSALSIQNMETILFGHMCFRKDSNSKWKYTPTCNDPACVKQYCDDCYGYVDPNTAYPPRGCPSPKSYWEWETLLNIIWEEEIRMRYL